MNHLARLSNEGNEYARRNFAWLANRVRLMRRVNEEAYNPVIITEPFKVIPVKTKRKGLREVFRNWLGMLMI